MATFMSGVWKYLNKLNEANVRCKLCNVKLASNAIEQWSSSNLTAPEITFIEPQNIDFGYPQ